MNYIETMTQSMEDDSILSISIDTFMDLVNNSINEYIKSSDEEKLFFNIKYPDTIQFLKRCANTIATAKAINSRNQQPEYN